MPWNFSTVFANALENAIYAVHQLPPEQRVIRCKCIRHPQLMFRVSTPYHGEVEFDQKGFPVVPDTSHGLGTRSIAAYCEKHGASCEYRTRNGWFTIQIVQTLWILYEKAPQRKTDLWFSAGVLFPSFHASARKDVLR